MKTQIITKRKKRIAVIFLCLFFVFAVFAIAGCTAEMSDESTSDISERLECVITGTEKPFETDQTEAETLETDVSSTETIISESEFTEIDSGFDRAIVLYADMSLEDIYADVINGGWCIIESVTVDSGVERLSEFYANTLLKSHDKILLASIERKNDTDITGITLYELSYHGYFTYRECRKSGDTPLSEIKSKDYHYLTLSTAGKDGDSNEFQRALILSRHSPMTFSTFLSAMLGDTDILRYYGFDGFDLIASISYADYDNYFKSIIEN